MKTTLDLPEELVRAMKLRAVMEGRKLRDVAAEVFRRGMAAPVGPVTESYPHRVKLPIIPAPSGVKSSDLTPERLLELELQAEREGLFQ